MNILVRKDQDLLDVIQMDARPVDRVRLADIIPFYPGLPNVTNKIIIINHYYENCDSRIIQLMKYGNRIINRVPEFKMLPVEPYDKERFDILSMTKRSRNWNDPELKLVLLDDLIISKTSVTL